jgi:ribonuclease E
MTRKRVGQGLIEAFSTTCESCGGRGIHIHSDPVNKVALEKDLEQRYSKTSKASIEDEDDDHDEIENHHDVSEVSNSNQDDVVVETAPATTTGRRKGRRAVSTGVISTN